MIRITSRVPGFRRAGIEHPGHPIVYPKDRFTPEQLRALKKEPMLIVEELDTPADDKKDATPQIPENNNQTPEPPNPPEVNGGEGETPDPNEGDGSSEDEQEESKPKRKSKKKGTEDQKDGGQG